LANRLPARGWLLWLAFILALVVMVPIYGAIWLWFVVMRMRPPPP
jgi:hypothetical protein